MARSHANALTQTIACCMLFTGLTGVTLSQPDAGQTTGKPGVDKAELAKALAVMKSGEPTNYHAELIAKAGAVEAIPALEAQFARATEPLNKAKFAEVLVRLGDKKDIYWDYLVELVRPALESNEPDPVLYDAQGKIVPGPSPEWIAWAKSHNASAHAAEEAIYIRPIFLKLIAETGDSRAIPILRQALSSPNELFTGIAAKGLARFQDTSSISQIVAACRRSPAGGAAFIAESLVYFDDPQAQAAFVKYVPKDRAAILRTEKAQGN
jgi:hypothetical protein